jgi:recombination protein RecA
LPPRQNELDRFRAGLARTYGDRVAPAEQVIAQVSTGSLTLDWALREGGWRESRIHEIVGPPDSAKTTLVICSMAAALRKYPERGVGYVDMEGTFEDDWAEANGLDLSCVEHLYADFSEQASDQARSLCRSGLYSMVVVDSIGAMESVKALEKDAVDPLPGRNAQVITRMCKHLASLSRQHRVTVILVNQLRAQIGSMGGDVSAGPKEMQHATTTRVQMTGGRQEPVKMQFYPGEDAEIVSRQFRGRVTRSKVVPPGRVAEFWVNNRPTDDYGPAGINEVDEYISVGVRLGAIEQDNGGNYTLPGTGKIKGRAGAVRALRGDEKLRRAVREAIFRLEGTSADLPVRVGRRPVLPAQLGRVPGRGPRRDRMGVAIARHGRPAARAARLGPAPGLGDGPANRRGRAVHHGRRLARRPGGAPDLRHRAVRGLPGVAVRPGPGRAAPPAARGQGGRRHVLDRGLPPAGPDPGQLHHAQGRHVRHHVGRRAPDGDLRRHHRGRCPDP